MKLDEITNQRAVWSQTKGPEDIPVWELQVFVGDGNKRKMVGFVKKNDYKHPPKKGTIEMFNGRLKQIKVNLDNYSLKESVDPDEQAMEDLHDEAKKHQDYEEAILLINHEKDGSKMEKILSSLTDDPRLVVKVLTRML